MVYHVEVANIATLEPNSPVMIDDVVVGSVRSLTLGDQADAVRWQDVLPTPSPSPSATPTD